MLYFSFWYLIVLVTSDQNEIMTAIADPIKTCGLAVVLLWCFFRCSETQECRYYVSTLRNWMRISVWAILWQVQWTLSNIYFVSGLWIEYSTLAFYCYIFHHFSNLICPELREVDWNLSLLLYFSFASQ